MVNAANTYAGKPISAGGAVAQGSEAIVDDRFKGAGNTRFTPLSPKYAKWKAKNFPGDPILQLTGRLRKSIVGRGFIRLLGGGAVMIVFRVPEYGLYHERGGPHLPRRSPVQPDANDARRVQAAFNRHFKALQKAAAARGGIKLE